MYFKKHIKDIILNNIDDTKYYKSYVIKKNMILLNYKADLQHCSEKYNNNNILNDINKIEILEKNDYYMKPYLIKTSTDDYNYDIDKMCEDLDKINLNQTRDSIKCIHNMGCDIKISECELIQGSQLILKKFQNSL